MKIDKDNFTGFFKPYDKNGYLSNWYNIKFTVDNVEFSSAEQYMMYSKAMLFGDRFTANKILNTSDNARIKQLGREVKPFNPKIWDSKCQEIMVRGLYEKFNQNIKIKEQLLSTGDTVLAECSPYDRIWGIGLSLDDSKRFYTEHWLGKNYLGNVLMEVREKLKK